MTEGSRHADLHGGVHAGPYDGCPVCHGEQVAVAVCITHDGRVFSIPDFKPSVGLPDLPALLRYMADVVVPE